MDPRLQHPYTCNIVGPTLCGKIFFLTQLIIEAKELIHEPPNKMLWFYGEYQPLYEKLVVTLGDYSIYRRRTAIL